MDFRHSFFLFLFGLILCNTGKAQNNLPIFAEPEIGITVKTESPWTYDFGISHRNLLYSEEFVFQEIQIELTHITSYALNDRNKIGAGIYYRFREIFSDSYQDEFRFLQQFSHSVKYSSVKTNHRFRFEQRFRKNTTFRFRYRLSASVPLSSEENEKKWFLTAHTEALWSMAKMASPEFDQRFALGFKKELSQTTEMKFGAEYKYNDYTHRPESELFLKMGLSIEL